MSWNFEGLEKKPRGQWDGRNWETFRPTRPESTDSSSKRQSPPDPSRAEPPSIALTLVITLLFGVFGLIPAAIHSDRARNLGAPTGKYWAACFFPLAVAVLFWVVVFAA